MSTEENKSIARRFFQEQDQLKGAITDELCAPNYTAFIGVNPPMDMEGHKQMGGVFWGAFPDLNQTIEETIAEGDKVVVRFTAQGTHTGDLMGMPPTHKQFKVGGMSILRIENGKVIEFREEFDEMAMMQQLGAIPASA